MNEEPNAELPEIFACALELKNPSERAAYLACACAGRPELKATVESLLAAQAHADEVLPQTLVPPSAETGDEMPGASVGRYELLQKIGEGGCGIVYMAEQEEPIRRRVALKVIKLGMDTKQVIARFEAERQALALMDHPNIAKVLDAGATETGRPYFVMELVRGLKITEYCDDNNLSTEERLNLFVQICQAVQHAHQKGIIHRDIKPSNILVTRVDGRAVPKIIDFGIAKATGGQVLTDKTVFTAFEQFIGTPAYMSPEQAELSGVDVDTRSDIYALGVLLYELLTGKTPFDQKELVAAGLDEMRRIIREKEPARPSARLSTLTEAEQTTVAKRRHVQPPQLIHQLRGDLDWIVMRALEKDRGQRYETADSLANDVLRHLNNEPIAARPPNRLYQFQKMVRRNKLVFAAAGAVAAALVLGLCVSTWLLFKERAAEAAQSQLRQQAQAEANKSKIIARLLKKMLSGVGPSVALGRDTAMLREILDNTAQDLEQNLKDQPEAEAELRSIIGDVYWALGQYTNAETMHRRALTIRRSLYNNLNTNVADSLDGVGNSLMWPAAADKAEPYFQEALSIRTNLLGPEHPQVAVSLFNLGKLRMFQARPSEAEVFLRQSLFVRMKLGGYLQEEVAQTLSRLSYCLIKQGRKAEAEASAREALDVLPRISGAEPTWDPEHTQSLLASALGSQGKLGEAEIVARRALESYRTVLGAEHIDTIEAIAILVGILKAQRKLAEAQSLAEEGLALSKKVFGSRYPTPHCLVKLAEVMSAAGKLAEAERAYRESLALWEQQPTMLSSEMMTRSCLVGVLREQGKLAELETFFRENVAAQKRLASKEARLREADLLGNWAKFRRAEGKLTDAARFYGEALEQVATTDSSLRQRLVGGLADVLKDQGNLAEAETSYLQALALSKGANDLEMLAWVLAGLGDLRRDQGKPAEAEIVYREGQEICRNLVFALTSSDPSERLATGLETVLETQGKLEQANSLSKERLDVLRNVGPSVRLANVLARLADRLRKQGKWTEAEPLYSEGLEVCRKVCPENTEMRQWLAKGLGAVLKSQGRLTEAEPVLRAAVMDGAKIWSNDVARWKWPLDNLTEVLLQQGKTEEVDKLYNELSRIASIPKPSVGARLVTQADSYSRRGKWKQAAEYCANAVEAEPTNIAPYLRLASISAFTGDMADYTGVRRQILTRFGASRDPSTCSKAAKACLILPCPAVDPLAISNWIQIAATASGPAWLRPWADLTIRHAYYRMGHFAQAVEGEQELISGSDPVPEREVARLCVLAMAQHQLNNPRQARAALAKAAEITRTKLPALDSGDLGASWWDTLLAHMLLHEAQALIGNEPPPQDNAAKP